MALTIYGSPQSRTMRVLWAATELALDYEHLPLAWDDPALKAPDFLRLNPAGTIPTIVHDGFALSESMAINLYLARTFSEDSSSLYPRSPTGEAEVWRWTLWAQAHLEPWVQRDAAVTGLRQEAGDRLAKLIDRSFSVLDRALCGRSWLVGDAFTIADLNVAGVLSPSRVSDFDLSPFGDLNSWLSACYQRPAARATRALCAVTGSRQQRTLGSDRKADLQGTPPAASGPDPPQTSSAYLPETVIRGLSGWLCSW